MRRLRRPRDVSPMAPVGGAAGNVISFPAGSAGARPNSNPFDQLTARLILDQHRRGMLQEGVLVALLAAATGLRP